MGVEVRYAKAGDVNIAYQVLGDGPNDLLYIQGVYSNMEVAWEEPGFARFLNRLASFSRLILFDRRGCGSSDRGWALNGPTLEERMEDVRAVLDAVGSERADLFGCSEGGSLAALFAASHPDRVRSMVLYATAVRYIADDDHPWGLVRAEVREAFHELVAQYWGDREATRAGVAMGAPSKIGDEAYLDWFAKFERHSLSRSAARAAWESASAYDLVDVFPAVRVPTLIVHRVDDTFIPVAHARRLAEMMPHAQLVEVPGVDHYQWVGDTDLWDVVQEYLTGEPFHVRDRRLLSLLFSDIDQSTARAVELGDRRWRELLAAHDLQVRDAIDRFGGREIKQLGDGFFVAFEGPARAVECALAIRDAAASLGITVRAGVHAGECEVVGDDLVGVAVHTAARLLDHAEPGQILVSATVCDLVAGSGLCFGDAATVELEGLHGTRQVYPVLGGAGSPSRVRRAAAEAETVFRRDGEYWLIGYAGQAVMLRDTKGLRDLHQLLSRPGREIHVLDLATASRAAAQVGLGSVDDRARAEYRQRLSELEEELDEADRLGDLARLQRARVEHDAVLEHLQAAYGLGGRSRETGSDAERARKAVTGRVHDAIGRIELQHPRLGRHLRFSIRTGRYCSYQPEQPVHWADR